MAALGAKLGTAYVDVQGDFSPLTKSASTSAGKVEGRFRGLGKTIAGGLIGAGAFQVVTKGIGSMISEYDEARKVGAQTNAVLKSTGGVANVTAKDVSDLAGSISKKVGIDDEAIQSGQNLLLTFTGVRNEVGKGNDIFNQATQTMTDMSVALGQDMKSSSIQLGKALNDPIKGVTALQRVGVSFTASQKEQIKAMVESGDTLGAQKLILSELNKEFGGSAAAAATPIDKLKVSLGNLAETGGAILVPALDKLAGALTAGLGFMQEHKAVAIALGVAFAALGVALVATKVKQIATTAAEGAGVIVKTAATVATAGWTAAQWLLNVALSANPIGLVIVGIVALVAAFILAWKHSETFRDIVTGAWNAIKAATEFVWGAIKAYLEFVWEVLKVALTTYFNVYKAIVTTVWNVIKTVTAAVWSAISTALNVVWTVISATATLAFTGIRTVVLGVWRAIRDTGKAIWDGIATALGLVWAGIKAAADLAWTAIKTVIVEPIKNAVSAIRSALGNDGLLGWLKDRWEDFDKIVGKIAGVFTTAFGKVSSAVESVYNWLKKVKDLVGDVIDFIGKIKLPKIHIPDVNPFGGEGGGNVGPTAPLTGGVDQFNPIAKGFGLTMTSAYRPGDPGWHGKNRARDYSNGTDTPQEMAFARYMAASYGSRLLELIHTPLGYGIKNGAKVPLSFWGSAVNAAHHNHVHVAYRMGGKSTMPEFARVGEDAPRWPEYHIATNPAYRGQNIALMHQAASDLNFAPAGGGVTLEVLFHDPTLKGLIDVRVKENDREKGAAYMAGVNG